MGLNEAQIERSPEFNYHLLRSALGGYRKNPDRLEPPEYRQVYRKALKSYELESLVLASREAEDIHISERQLDQSLAEVARRYGSHDEFEQDLERNGLDPAILRKALYRELLFDAVMQRVAARSATVNELDVHLFYEMHHDRFQVPETRIASHILITINPDYSENTPAAALGRMRQVLEKLAGRGNRFSEFAKRYSECPTAMEGGKLGEISRGQLYEVLDRALFAMQEGQISPILESEMGYHLLFCERIKPAKRVPLAKVASRIREILQQRHRRNCQKAWLASLQRIENA